MKKYILMAIMALNIGFMSNAYAAGTAFTGQTTVLDTACTILSQNATLNASADVNAAWACNAATNLAFGAACHKGGSAKNRTVACSCVLTGTTWATNNTQCTSTCSINGTLSAPENVTVNGRQAFGGSTNGGSIAPFALSGTGATAACDATSITTISLFP